MRLLILLILSPFFLFSQILFVEHILEETQEPTNDVYASDLDGDGDLDLLGNKSYGHIVWFENTDGLGGFGEANTIDYQGGIGHTFTTDLDGDGDQDVLVASGFFWYEGISWYENTDGAGTFGGPITIDIQLADYGSAFAADLDNDGDMDVIVGYNDNNWGFFAWYKNDGSGNFSSAILISYDRLIVDGLAVDIDSDGDMDLCTASYYSPEPGGGNPRHEVTWYKNIGGLGTFNSGTTISTGIEPIGNIKTTDLDGDGNEDVLAISDDKVIWFENTDGFGTFGPANIIGEEEGFYGMEVDDIDSDGDTDVIASWGDSNLEGGIVWYENNGLGTFGPKQTITFTTDYWIGYHPIYTGDFDSDTDIDVFEGLSDKFSWYENSMILGGVSFASTHFSIYPNPTKDYFTITLNESIALDRINIYNHLAQLISSTQETTVNTSHLSSGMYFVEVITDKGKATKKLILN